MGDSLAKPFGPEGLGTSKSPLKCLSWLGGGLQNSGKVQGISGVQPSSTPREMAIKSLKLGRTVALVVLIELL